MKTPKPMSLTLRVLARLLSYPDDALREHLDELRLALRQEAALQPSRLGELDALIGWMGRQEPLDLEAEYVQLFDSGRRTALHLFEHVHGDSRERGPAMIDLAQTYEKAGLYLAEGEMPDHLPVLLEFASTPELRALSLSIFDRSFAVTRYLQAVAIAIGLVGIAASLSAQVLARRKEFGLLSHLGLTRAQIVGVVAGEGAAWLAAGTLIGLALGLAVSVVLVHVVNPQSFPYGY